MHSSLIMEQYHGVARSNHVLAYPSKNSVCMGIIKTKLYPVTIKSDKMVGLTYTKDPKYQGKTKHI